MNILVKYISGIYDILTSDGSYYDEENNIPIWYFKASQKFIPIGVPSEASFLVFYCTCGYQKDEFGKYIENEFDANLNVVADLSLQSIDLANLIPTHLYYDENVIYKTSFMYDTGIYDIALNDIRERVDFCYNKLSAIETNTRK